MVETKKRGRGRPPGSKNRPKDSVKAKPEKEPKAAAGKTTEHDRVILEDLTDEQHFALMMQHAKTISAAEGRMEKVKKDLKAARDLARADLGKDALHEIKLYHELESDEGQRKLKDRMDMQVRMARWSGMPVGHIDDLFSDDRTPIEDRTRADGKRAGLAGDDNAPPHHLDGPLKSKWQEGYNEGQAILAKGFKPTKANGEPFGAPPPEPEQTVDEKGATYWLGMGRVAFEKRHNGDCPDEVPEWHREHWTMGYRNAQSAAKHNGPAAASDPKGAGILAREAGDGCAVPTDLSKEDGALWHAGWREKDAEIRGVVLEDAA